MYMHELVIVRQLYHNMVLSQQCRVYCGNDYTLMRCNEHMYPSFRIHGWWILHLLIVSTGTCTRGTINGGKTGVQTQLNLLYNLAS